MKKANNSVKYEVLVKQYLPAFLDISALKTHTTELGMHLPKTDS